MTMLIISNIKIFTSDLNMALIFVYVYILATITHADLRDQTVLKYVIILEFPKIIMIKVMLSSHFVTKQQITAPTMIRTTS